MKRIALLLSLMMVAAACASGTETDAGETSANAPADVLPKPEGLLAPDFTMALATGDSFTLSQEQKPVYMIFWAEW